MNSVSVLCGAVKEYHLDVLLARCKKHSALVSSATKTFTGNMTSVETQATSKGEIYVNTANDNMKIFVDDGGSYKATPNAQGQIDIYFKPLDGVSETIESNGIPLILTLSITGLQQTVKDDGGHDVQIFTPKETHVIDLGNGIKQTSGDHIDAFKVTVTGEQVLALMNFCNDGTAEDHNVTLDTLDENKQFGQALNTYTINLTISEKAA